MFEHTFEKDIASNIVAQFHKKRLLCETDPTCFHKIGLPFLKLLKLLNITIQIFIDTDKIDIISPSSLLELEVPEGGIDVSPIITKEANNHEIMVVKFLQTLSYLKELEENNLIVIFKDIKHTSQNKPAIYDSYDLIDPNIVEFVHRLFYSRIIPTTALIELASHDFITEDKRQYKKQVELSEKAIVEAKTANDIAVNALSQARVSNKRAKYSMWIAIGVALITSVLSIYIATNIPTSLTDDSINKIGREFKNNCGAPSVQIVNITSDTEKETKKAPIKD